MLLEEVQVEPSAPKKKMKKEKGRKGRKKKVRRRNSFKAVKTWTCCLFAGVAGGGAQSYFTKERKK